MWWWLGNAAVEMSCDAFLFILRHYFSSLLHIRRVLPSSLFIFFFFHKQCFFKTWPPPVLLNSLYLSLWFTKLQIYAYILELCWTFCLGEWFRFCFIYVCHSAFLFFMECLNSAFTALHTNRLVVAAGDLVMCLLEFSIYFSIYK